MQRRFFFLWNVIDGVQAYPILADSWNNIFRVEILNLFWGKVQLGTIEHVLSKQIDRVSIQQTENYASI